MVKREMSTFKDVKSDPQSKPEHEKGDGANDPIRQSASLTETYGVVSALVTHRPRLSVSMPHNRHGCVIL